MAALVLFFAGSFGCGGADKSPANGSPSHQVTPSLAAGASAAPTLPASTPPSAPASGAAGSSGLPSASTAPIVPTRLPTAGAGETPSPGKVVAASGGNSAASAAGAAAVSPAGAGSGAAPAIAGRTATPTAGAASADALIRGDDPTDSTGTKDGPYKVAKYTTGFADKPGFSAGTIYYPEDADPPFAHVVFCPGFVSYQTSIQDWGPFLASYGIVIMTIDTNSSSDSVTLRQTALKDALGSLQAENERGDSPLKGKLHMSRFGLMGWSMGGGASLLNGSMHPEYKSVVTVAEHLATAPSMDAPLKSLTVPVLMFAGTADTAILGLNMSQPAYETIPDTTTKMLYEVKNADHFFFNTPHALGGVVGKYGLAWQKVFLEGDERYRKLLTTQGPMASDFRTNLK